MPIPSADNSRKNKNQTITLKQQADRLQLSHPFEMKQEDLYVLVMTYQSKIF